MSKYELKIYTLYISFCFLFVVSTNNYLSLQDIIYVANQTDAISYVEIAKIAPMLPMDNGIIIQHVAQRFIIPYMVGSLAFFLNVDFFIVFKFVTFFFILFYIFLINLASKKLDFNLRESILFFSILFLNPYIVRNHIFNPVQAHDMLFFCVGLIFALSLIKKNYFSNGFASIVATYLRQTSIALFIGSSFFLLTNKKFKLFFLLLCMYFFSFFLVIKTGQFISSNVFPTYLAYQIIFYDFSQVEKLIKFLLLGIMPFFPLSIIILGTINKKISASTIIILLFTCSMMIGQPILGGPDGSVNNVGRIANLCFPILTVLCFYVWNFQKFLKNDYLFYIFIIGMFMWSLHPTFSIFKFFGILRFYNY